MRDIRRLLMALAAWGKEVELVDIIRHSNSIIALVRYKDVLYVRYPSGNSFRPDNWTGAHRFENQVKVKSLAEWAAQYD